MKIKALSLIAFSVGLLCSCYKLVKEQQTNLNHQSFLCSGVNISFDSIEYYHITESEHYSIQEKNIKTNKDKKLLSLTDSFFPKELQDSIVSSDFLSIGFKARQISRQDYNHICQLFQEDYQYIDSTACSPNFRDLLIFKKQHEITGFAKICYQCGHSIVLTKNSTREVDVYRLDALVN